MTTRAMRVVMRFSVLSTLIGLAVGAGGTAIFNLVQHSASAFLPRSHCLNSPILVALLAVADTSIFLSYMIIGSTLMFVVFRVPRLALLTLRNVLATEGELESIVSRHTAALTGMGIAFTAFITTCGMTHLMEVVTLWRPVYGFSVAIKIICAAASVVTASRLLLLASSIGEPSG